MENTWDILVKELAIHGIKLIDSGTCSILYDKKFIKLPIRNILGSIKKRTIHNGKIFEELWVELLNLLESEQPVYEKPPLDDITIRLFINTIKDLLNFASFLTKNFDFENEELENKVTQTIRESLNKDYTQFSIDVILLVPDYKIGLDWVFRNISRLAYLRSMLNFIRFGYKRISDIPIKTARGISGPWANLDLPILERRYPWSDIAEEMTGRERDKKHQRRYRQGFYNYNDPYGRVGEGHYWREMRNEPFSWTSKNYDSPYPSRHTLSKWV